MATDLTDTVERIEKNKVKFTFTIPPERFKEGLLYSYNKNKSRVRLDGFRQGKASRKVIERLYGKDFFYGDAFNHLLPDIYEAVCDERGIAPVYRPDIHLDEADEDTGAVFTAEVYVKPEVAVDGYYGLTYPRQDTEATDSDIQDMLQKEREKNARQVSVDRPAQLDDTVTINFVGYVDGVPFENGDGKDFDLTLGSHSFIDTFEEQLVGLVPGDEAQVRVAFPADYHHADLAGQDAMFEVEMLDVKAKEYPELDDEFAQDVSEFDTLAEYKDDLAQKIQKTKEQQRDMAKLTHVLEALAQKAVMDVPEVMYTARVEDMREEFEARLGYQGLSLTAYCNYYRTSEAQLLAEWTDSAHKDVDARLALEAVARQENLTVTDEDFDAHIEEMAAARRRDAKELTESLTPGQLKDIRESLLIQKAQDFVLEKAIATDTLDVI